MRLDMLVETQIEILYVYVYIYVCFLHQNKVYFNYSPFPRRWDSKCSLKCKIEILDGQSSGLFSNETLEKRPVMTIEDFVCRNKQSVLTVVSSKSKLSMVKVLVSFQTSPLERKMSWASRKSESFLIPATIRGLLKIIGLFCRIWCFL